MSSIHGKSGVVMELAVLFVLALCTAGLRLPVGYAGDRQIAIREKTEWVPQIPATDHRTVRPPVPSMPIAGSAEAILSEETIVDTEVPELLSLPPMPVKSNQLILKDEADEFIAYDKEPVLVGGDAYLKRHICYPEIALKAGMEGSAIIQLLVSERGQVVEAVILHEDGNCGFGTAAREVLLKARFEPAMQRDRPVKARISIPVQFRLHN